MTLTPDQLDEIERRAMAASPGPWCFFNVNRVLSVMLGRKPKPNGNKEIVKWTGFDGADFSFSQNAGNAAFIASARTDVPALIAALRTEKERVRELASAVWQVLDDMGAKGNCCCDGAKAALKLAFEPFEDHEDVQERDMLS